MNYLHYEFDLDENDVVEVILEGRANVRLLDDENYERYRNGEQHRYHGGFAKTSPVEIPAPRAGHWHIVVDLGGYAGTVRATANVLRGAT
ncbi:MAG: DUF1883 domain-containing protein [Planctomycetes bacterium]|nr:DUF1883 domain-containing protein [Planctomycetota bacterium]